MPGRSRVRTRVRVRFRVTIEVSITVEIRMVVKHLVSAHQFVFEITPRRRTVGGGAPADDFSTIR